MLTHLAIAAVAASSPLLGVKTLRADSEKPNLRPAAVQFLDRDLEPVEGSPEFPPFTRLVERSPDGAAAAAAKGHRVLLYAIGSGKRTASVPVAGGPRTLSWLAPDRLMVLSNGYRAGVGVAVDIIDPAAGKVVTSLKVPGELEDTAPAEGHQIVMTMDDQYRSSVVSVSTNGVATTPVTSAKDESFEALDANHVLTATQDKRGETVASTVLGIDPVTGAGTRRALARPAGDWVQPTRDGLLATITGAGVSFSDATTLDEVATAAPCPKDECFAYDLIAGTGDGVLFGGRRLKRFGDDGKLRWKADVAGAALMRDGKRWVLPEFSCKTARFSTTIVDDGTGDVHARQPGGWALTEPAAGRLHVPRFGFDRASSGRTEYEDC